MKIGISDNTEGAVVAGGLSRRELLTAAAGGTAALLLPSASARAAVHRGVASGEPLFRELDGKITKAMREFQIPGVAVGVLYRGREYIKGYGVTNVDYPVAVDGDTVFRIGSTTKTFTGTVLMRLVEQGKISLDAPVRRYLPEFTSSGPASKLVTVRQVLNHTAGWLGDDLQDFGRGSDAVARYVASMKRLPQLTPPGRVFAYNNAALVLAGRLIEIVTGQTYESAVRAMLVDPLGLGHTRFFSDEIVGFNVAAPHDIVKGKVVVDPSFWAVPRSINPAGGLMSSVRDQLRYARFHLGDGRTRNGKRLLSRRSLEAMQSNPGPGGTLFVELNGMGVTWMLRPSAQRVPIVQHGGAWFGQLSGFMMVPGRGFAITALTNSVGGGHLIAELFVKDWALRRFAGLSNLPATPQRRSRASLAPYEGRYVAEEIGMNGKPDEQGAFELRAHDGRLRNIAKGASVSALVFYRPEYVLNLNDEGKLSGVRSNFVRGADGRVAWLRVGGRLYRRQA